MQVIASAVHALDMGWAGHGLGIKWAVHGLVCSCAGLHTVSAWHLLCWKLTGLVLGWAVLDCARIGLRMDWARVDVGWERAVLFTGCSVQGVGCARDRLVSAGAGLGMCWSGYWLGMG